MFVTLIRVVLFACACGEGRYTRKINVIRSRTEPVSEAVQRLHESGMNEIKVLLRNSCLQDTGWQYTPLIMRRYVCLCKESNPCFRAFLENKIKAASGISIHALGYKKGIELTCVQAEQVI